MSANTLVVRGFVNKIDCVASAVQGGENKYFAKIAYSLGDSTNRQTQYVSCFVSKSLHRIANAAFQTQAEHDGKFSNVLGSQLSELTIVNPFFKINDGGYIEGSGILTSISFVTPELKPKSSS
jgi:hypothetical protein